MISKISTPMFLAAALLGSAAAYAAPPAATYVAKAGASDMYEKESSKLVLATTKNAGVRTFANDMVKDHTTSTAKVTAAAAKSGVKAGPPMLDAPKKAMIAKLTAAKGPARDTLYIQQQKMAHQEALALHQDYAKTGDKAPLKAAAGEITPVVQHHIQMLNAMPSM